MAVSNVFRLTVHLPFLYTQRDAYLMVIHIKNRLRQREEIKFNPMELAKSAFDRSLRTRRYHLKKYNTIGVVKNKKVYASTDLKNVK